MADPEVRWAIQAPRLFCAAIRHPQNLAQNIGFQLSKFSKITHEPCGQDVDSNCQALHPYCMPFRFPTLALC